MYNPSSNQITDPAKLASFIEQYSFATLISNDGETPFASHLPMLFKPEDRTHGKLISHMARSNPQWKHFDSGHEMLVIFQGPHSYISPSWYQTEFAVPTWNYGAVHVYGVPRIIDEHTKVVALLDEMIAFYERGFEQPWPGKLPKEFRDNKISAIVAFEIPITRIEGKFKLGQNRTAEDLSGVVDSLSKSSDSNVRDLIDLMGSEGLI